MYLIPLHNTEVQNKGDMIKFYFWDLQKLKHFTISISANCKKSNN